MGSFYYCCARSRPCRSRAITSDRSTDLLHLNNDLALPAGHFEQHLVNAGPGARGMQNEQSTRPHSLDGLAANSDLVWTCRDCRKAVKLVVVASPHDHGQIATRLQCNIRLAYSQAAW